MGFFLSVCNESFLLREFESEFCRQKFRNIFFCHLTVFFAPDYPNQKIIGIANVLHSFVAFVHWQTVRHISALHFNLSDFSFNYVFICFWFSLFQLFYKISSFGFKFSVLRISFSVFSLVEFLDILLHIFVQFIQINIGKNGADNSALRCAAVGLMIYPIFNISCFQKFSD